MDGYGIKDAYGNAIVAASKPNLDKFFSESAYTTIGASGMAVGLPDGQMGNSEVGHTNMGAGRIVYQELTRITKSIKDGNFFDNEALKGAMENCKANGSALHLMGLMSDGGVHSHITHLYAIVEMAKKYGLTEVYVHCFLDGRDVPPASGADYVAQLRDKLAEIGVGKIATVMGRYYAMDRDNRWERVVIFFNFRPDRAREITRTLVDPDFSGFERRNGLFPLYYVCMTQYDATMPNVHVAFKPQSLKNTLGEYISSLGMTQLRIAETEKYAHVTFFFNGGVEKVYEGEDRVLVKSPAVATYDLQPEMSAYEVRDRLVECVLSGKYDIIIVNFANCDMVGHTGIFDAAKAAVEAVDTCVGDLVEAAVNKMGGVVMITADHGNADQMLDEKGEPFTAHSTNPVPFCVVGYDCKLREGGCLADIAPTMLEVLGIPQPEEMTGVSLIAK